MRPRLFNLAAALSLVLLLATIVLWARAQWTWSYESFVVTTRADDERQQSRYYFRNSPFGLSASRDRLDMAGDSPGWKVLRSTALQHDAYVASLGGHGTAGFRWALRDWPYPYVRSRLDILLAHWTLALLTMIVPAAWLLARWRRQTKIAAGRCAKCGYDLRATPDRCPECGTATSTAKAAA